MTFIEKLQALSRRKGRSLRAISKELGFDPSAPAQWKIRQSQPRPEISKSLADYFQIPVDILLDDKQALPEQALDATLRVEEEQAPWKTISAAINDPEEEITELRRLLSAAQTRLDNLTIYVRRRKKK